MSTQTFRVEPEPVHAPRGAPKRWWWAAGVLAAAGVVTLAAVLVGDGDGPDRIAPPAASVAPSSSPATSPAPSVAPTAPVAPPLAIDRSTAVWPVAGTAGLTDPVKAARAFAVDYLGFADPVVGAFAQGDSRSGEVEVRALASGPATTVLLRQLSGESTWSVLGAGTANIEVTRPEAGATISSPVEVQGSALAFEGNVVVQVRQDGTAAPLGEAPVTGGGDVLRPFAGSIPFRAPTSAYGALVLLTHSAKDGSVWEAAVLRVRLSGGGGMAPVACALPKAPAPPPGSMVVRAYFTCDPASQALPAPIAVERVVQRQPGVLAASLGALLAGPSADERAAGLTSWFSGATAGMLHGVRIDAGHAVVDLGDLPSVIPGASSSAGAALLLSELDATVLQFPTVESAEYRLDGSCEAFTEWLQMGGCAPRTR